jgi:hypothetical protein
MWSLVKVHNITIYAEPLVSVHLLLGNMKSIPVVFSMWVIWMPCESRRYKLIITMCCITNIKLFHLKNHFCLGKKWIVVSASCSFFSLLSHSRRQTINFKNKGQQYSAQSATVSVSGSLYLVLWKSGSKAENSWSVWLNVQSSVWDYC